VNISDEREIISIENRLGLAETSVLRTFQVSDRPDFVVNECFRFKVHYTLSLKRPIRQAVDLKPEKTHDSFRY